MASDRGKEPEEVGEQAIDTKIELDWSTQPRPVFANFAQVSHTANEFILFFGDYMLTPKVAEEIKAGGPAKAPIVAVVRTTPSTMFAIIHALIGNWNKYVENTKGMEGLEPPKIEVGGGQ